MKRRLFIFIFICFGFMYAPLPKASGVSQGACFQEENLNVLASSELPKETPVIFSYGNLLTSWKAKVESSGVVLLSNNINSIGIFQQEISGVKHFSSTEKCEFYSFQVKRNQGVLKYDLPLERQDRNAEGRKLCYYKLSDGAVREIASLGGGAVSQNDICPELVNGRVQIEGEECAATAACNVNVRAGEKETLALGVDKDYCGKEFVYELNNGNKILETEVNAKASEFIRDCESGESVRDKLEVNAVSGGGTSSDDEELNSGASCGCRRDIVPPENNQPECTVQTTREFLSGKAEGSSQCECGQVSNPSSETCPRARCAKGGTCGFFSGNSQNAAKCECQPNCQSDSLTCIERDQGNPSDRYIWCCPKYDARYYLPQKCGAAAGTRCLNDWMQNEADLINLSDLGIVKLLPPSGLPPGCDCSNSVLFIIGGDILENDDEILRPFLNYAVMNYIKMRSENNRDCTFITGVTGFDNMDDLAQSFIGKFKKVAVFTHGEPGHTGIDLGGSFGALTCSGASNTYMLSCLVGERPFFGLGTPRVVENYCVQANPGSTIQVSQTLVRFGISPDIPLNNRPETEFSPIICTKANWECWECLQQNPPRAKVVPCQGNAYHSFVGN